MDSRQKHAGMTDSRHPVNGYYNYRVKRGPKPKSGQIGE